MIVRAARPEDDADLRRIDVATWTVTVSPAPPSAPDTSFFELVSVNDVLVAEVNGVISGYVTLGAFYELASSSHVFEVKGLAVDPERQRRGIARSLMAAAVELARERAARRVLLRVLGSNAPARALYQACGFAVVGVLPEQFLLDGRYVDDVFMTIDLGA